MTKINLNSNANPNLFRTLEGRLCSKESKNVDDITTMTLTLTKINPNLNANLNVDENVKMVADSKLSLPQFF